MIVVLRSIAQGWLALPIGPMCEKCELIDRRLAGYQNLRSGADDPLALGLIAEAIAEMVAEKLALHPEDGSAIPAR